MTAVLAIGDDDGCKPEKSEPQVPSSPRIQPRRNFDNGPGVTNGYLTNRIGRLKVAQIVLSIFAMVLIRPRYQDACVEYLFLFVTFNAPIVTGVLLWDEITNGENIKKFLTTAGYNFDRLMLFYCSGMALLYYSLSFGMLASFVGFYNPKTNILAGVIGMIVAGAYGYHWWLLFRERVFRQQIVEKAAELHQQGPSEVIPVA
ncbi:CKLF-like MARVEL transmembrane domain-containing protein 4 [Uranotaenia lowii]|uniref:CKLF-like MARVEL transmembrane domain-containing protein 4 n=1 Tax=Uranotaenia lowii TaxID=190385 RepID=UPI00247A854B|nr:CKLF-like MARVEL transmembrane domain-containing protein 4 [Uranotaenia lowii]